MKASPRAKLNRVFDPLFYILMTINKYDGNAHNLFSRLQFLPDIVQSYRRVKSELKDEGFDVSSYDNKIESLLDEGPLNRAPLSRKGIVDCLPSYFQDSYQHFCDERDKQAENMMHKVFDPLEFTLREICAYDHKNDNLCELFSRIKNLIDEIQSYRRVRSRLESEEFDTSPYDDIINPLLEMDGMPLRKIPSNRKKITDCLHPDFQDSYNLFCSNSDRQVKGKRDRLKP